MAKTKEETTEVAAEAPAEVAPAVAELKEFPQTLDEFCRRLSLTEPRYMLIGGFHHTEQAAGRLKDVPSAYTKRYSEYLTTPIR